MAPPAPADRLDQRVDQRADRVLGVGHGDGRHEGVPVGHLEGEAEPHQVVLDHETVGPGAGQAEHQPGRVDLVSGTVQHPQTLHIAAPAARRADELDGPAEQALAVQRQQPAGRVDAREDGPGRARRVRRVETALQPVRVQPLGAREHQRTLRVGGQRLVRARDEGVRAGRQRVRGQCGMEAEVRGPGLVHQQRCAGVVRRVGQAGHVGPGPGVARLHGEHGTRRGVGGERSADRVDRQPAGQPGHRVDGRRDPDRAQPGEHEPEQQRAVHGAGDDDLVAGPADRQRQRLVPVRRAGHREPAQVRAPELGRELLGVHQDAGRRAHRGQRTPQRQVTLDHPADELGRALVPGDHERHRPCPGRREAVVQVGDRGAVLVGHGAPPRRQPTPGGVAVR